MVSRSSRSPGSTVFRVVVNKLAVLLNKLAILKYVDVFQIRRWKYRTRERFERVAHKDFIPSVVFEILDDFLVLANSQPTPSEV